MTAIRLNKMNPKKKLTIIYVLIGVIILCGGFAAFHTIATMNAQRETREQYITNVSAASLLITLSAAQAEELTGLTSRVWNNAIRNVSHRETNRFTIRPDRFIFDDWTYQSNDFVDDFNIALLRLFFDNDTREVVSAIEDMRDTISDLMRELQNPPDELANVYVTIMELHAAYEGLAGLAINPTGSLTSFNDSRRGFIDDIVRLYRRLQVEMPNE